MMTIIDEFSSTCYLCITMSKIGHCKQICGKSKKLIISTFTTNMLLCLLKTALHQTRFQNFLPHPKNTVKGL